MSDERAIRAEEAQKRANEHMGKLTDALPRQKVKEENETPVKHNRGTHPALWIGMSTPHEVVSQWANDKCKLCKGKGTGYNGEGECRACHGSGRLTEIRVNLLYRFEDGVIEEEDVNYKISTSGQNPETGQMYSPSTLYMRLCEFADMQGPSEKAIDDWYSALPDPPNIPIEVSIGFNKPRTALKITNVALRQNGAMQSAGGQVRAFGGGAADEKRSFQPAMMDKALGDEIIALAEKCCATVEEWDAVWQKHSPAGFSVGVTTLAAATAIRTELGNREIPF